MSRLLCFAIMFGSGVGLLSAQSGPVDPVLKRAPNSSEWTVKFVPSEASVKAAFAKNGKLEEGVSEKVGLTSPKSIIVSKDGTTYRVVEQWSDGRSREKWAVGDMQLYETALSKKIVRLPRPTAAQMNSDYSDYRRSDFEELEWINQKSFSGIKEIGGRKVYEFSGSPATRQLTLREQGDVQDVDAGKSQKDLEKDFRTASGGATYVAYLDVQTQLPLYFDDGRVIRIYEFSANGPGGLQVPPRFAAEIEAWKKEPPPRRLARP